jgi:arginine utilization protein RocB
MSRTLDVVDLALQLVNIPSVNPGLMADGGEQAIAHRVLEVLTAVPGLIAELQQECISFR